MFYHLSASKLLHLSDERRANAGRFLLAGPASEVREGQSARRGVW
jgi:hypothetical protein